MNYLQKNQENKRLRNLFTRAYPEGCVKITGNVSSKHEITKASVCYYLKKEGYEIWTEATVGRARPDIIAIKGPHAYIIEILYSESKAKFESKRNYYPEGFTLIPVDAKTFKYEDFCL